MARMRSVNQIKWIINDKRRQQQQTKMRKKLHDNWEWNKEMRFFFSFVGNIFKCHIIPSILPFAIFLSSLTSQRNSNEKPKA